MSNDLTGTIAQIYGKAFMASGQGQFGAAGQAVKFDGSAAGGPEPIPFELACEIQGATSAWSKSGKDVNALLQSHFQLRAVDWAAANSWWMSQLTADLSRFSEYNAKCDAYERRYAGERASDADLRF